MKKIYTKAAASILAAAVLSATGISALAAEESFGWRGLRIDLLGRCVFVDNEKAELTAKEYGVLAYLAENRGITLTRGQILDAVWGYDAIGDDRTVDWQIKLLRGKLGRYRECIVTMRGMGYKFETQDE